MKKYFLLIAITGGVLIGNVFSTEGFVFAQTEEVIGNKELMAEDVPVVEEVIEEPAKKEKIPSLEFVKKAWSLSGQVKMDELDALVEEVLLEYGDLAKEQIASLDDFPPHGQEKDYQAMNDVATVLFVRAEAYMNQGKTEKAIAYFEEIINSYPWAQAWDPRGWFWKIKEKSEDSIKVMTGQIEDEELKQQTGGLKTLPKLHQPGTQKIIDYMKFGDFFNVGTDQYQYSVKDPIGLSKAAGEFIYPNTGAVLKDPGFKKAKEEGRLEGSHWDFVYSDDLEAALYKWATAKEEWGIKLYYIGLIFEKAKMYYEAIKAYHALVVHFPKAVGWTYWQTPWYPAQAAIAKIKHIARVHPELELQVQFMKINVGNGFDNDISNDQIVVYPGVVRERTFFDKLKARLGLEKKTVALGKVKRTIGQGKVQLVQYENGHWQLLLNKKPYVICGITYQPTKIGQSPDKGTLVSWMAEDENENGLPDAPYESWVDANKNNKQDANEPIVGDFQLMQEMGINTIREYYQPFKPKKQVLRSMFEKYGIRVAMGNFLGKYTLGSGASWFDGTDYENPEHQKNMMDSVREMVLEFKDEPYLLLWILGNENNYGVACNADKKPEAYFKFVNQVAQMIKSLDPDHPVALCNGDVLYLDIFAKHAPDVDIYAANAYRGDYGFGSFWEQVRDATGKTAFITEFGSPAFARHLSIEEAEKAQADYHRGNWMDIDANMAGVAEGVGNSLGGFIFAWTDEWWKNYKPFYHDKKSDAIGPFPGGYYYEEWFGITSQGNGTQSPFLRQLRQSYFAYQEMWQKYRK